MKPTLKQALGAVALAGGFLLCGGQAALADDGIASDAGSTVQVSNVSPSAGVTVCGNSAAVLDAQTQADCNVTQSSTSGGESDVQRNSAPGDRDGIASDAGSTVQVSNVSPSAGVTVCGNSAAVLDAQTQADCNVTQSSTSGGESDVQRNSAPGDRDGIASDAGSTVQVSNVSPSAGVTVCGNSAAVGDAGGSARCGGRRTTTSRGDAGGETPEVARVQDRSGKRKVRTPPQVLGLHLTRPEDATGEAMTKAQPVTTLAERSRTGRLPLTGGLFPGLGWATLFLVAGTGLVITDALTN